MDIDALHKLIDDWAAKQPTITFTPPSDTPAEVVAEAPKKPEGKRVVRTKNSGDRVYLLDEVKKTRAWISKPELVDELGFSMADVVEVEDSELIRYQMLGPIYKVD